MGIGISVEKQEFKKKKRQKNNEIKNGFILPFTDKTQLKSLLMQHQMGAFIFGSIH